MSTMAHNPRYPEYSIPGTDMANMLLDTSNPTKTLIVPKSIMEDFENTFVALRVSLASSGLTLRFLSNQGFIWSTTNSVVTPTDTYMLSPRVVYITCNQGKVTWWHKNPLGSYVDAEVFAASKNDHVDDNIIKTIEAELKTAEKQGGFRVIPAIDMRYSRYFSGRISNDLSLSQTELDAFKAGEFWMLLDPGVYKPVFGFFSSHGFTWQHNQKAVHTMDTPAANPAQIYLTYDDGLVWYYSPPEYDAKKKIHPVYVLQPDPWIEDASKLLDTCIVDFDLDYCYPEPLVYTKREIDRLARSANRALSKMIDKGLMGRIKKNLQNYEDDCH